MESNVKHVITKDFLEKFRENGFAIIPGFLSQDEVKNLKEATHNLVQKYCKDAPISIFKLQSRDKYFAESGDKIRGFFEEKSVDKDGNLLVPDLEEAFNKIGHALHCFEKPFNRITFSSKVHYVLKELCNMKTPIVNQSMVIFKNPKIGGLVFPHQDATYLHVEPTEGNLIGFWIALDDATLENGCLHFLPGSHKGKLYQRFVRNPDKDSSDLFITRGEKVPPPPKEKLVPAPAKPGDLVLIDGLVIHQSEPNTSKNSRLAYTFHVIEGEAKYSTENWLQPTSENTFMKFPNV